MKHELVMALLAFILLFSPIDTLLHSQDTSGRISDTLEPLPSHGEERPLRQ
jgi:hypothetical protein